jgi:hypothetical protein
VSCERHHWLDVSDDRQGLDESAPRVEADEVVPRTVDLPEASALGVHEVDARVTRTA